jgi:glycosyltransferase involved in cell wall biosynthesis
MKITFILHYADWGGGCRVIATYAHRLIQQGHEVVAVHQAQAFRSRLSDELTNIFSTARWKSARSHLDALDIPQLCLAKHQTVTDANIPNADVVIATYWKTAREVLALSPEKGKKVYFLQSYEIDFVGSEKDRFKETWTYPMRKILVAPWLKEIAEREFGDSSGILVPNGISTEQFNAPPRQKRTRPTVGFIFHPYVLKGADIAIEAFELLRKEIPDLRVISFGNSWRRSIRNGPTLPKGTEYHVRPPQNRIRDLYSQCDVWVCPSRNEGYGLPALEAMACRTPVVSTPTGIAPQLAGQGGLLLAPHEDPEGLACEIRRILELSPNEWKNISQQAYATARQFDVEKSAREFEEALETVIAGR